jgi:hypothetical protein
LRSCNEEAYIYRNRVSVMPHYKKESQKISKLLHTKKGWSLIIKFYKNKTLPFYYYFSSNSLIVCWFIILIQTKYNPRQTCFKTALTLLKSNRLSSCWEESRQACIHQGINLKAFNPAFSSLTMGLSKKGKIV